MYFGLMKYLIIGFFILSLFLGGISVIIIRAVVGDTSYRGLSLRNFAAKFSIKSILSEKISATDAIMGINIVGVVFITFYSVYVRRKLQDMAEILDENEVSPSDYGLLVRDIPNDWTKEKLEGVIEDHFKLYGLNVNYVNYCFNVTEMVKLNKKMGELIKLKNLVK